MRLAGPVAVVLIAIAIAVIGSTMFHHASTAPSVSSNWGGYAATARGSTASVSFGAASATWRQPKLRCTKDDAGAASSVWVGIGGYNTKSQRLDQVGTEADCSMAAQPIYDSWYELLPAGAVRLPVTVRPGDAITASVRLEESGREVRLRLADRTLGTSVTRYLAVSRSDSTSAEWIVEAPATCNRTLCRTLPLADFGTVTFSGISVTGNGHTGTLSDPHWAAERILLLPAAAHAYSPGARQRPVGAAKSRAGALASGLSERGASFVVTWEASVPRDVWRLLVRPMPRPRSPALPLVSGCHPASPALSCFSDGARGVSYSKASRSTRTNSVPRTAAVSA